jgi:fructose-1,6-bisphosphatase I
LALAFCFLVRLNLKLINLSFREICQACKVIRSLVDRACIAGMTGYEGGGGSINIQGEEQKKLDVITNDVLSKNLRFTGQALDSHTCKVANISFQ